MGRRTDYLNELDGEGPKEERKYPKARSLVTVTYMDGEVASYEINAGLSISRYLADQVSMNGVLSLFDWGVTSVCIPVQAIRNWQITALPVETEPPPPPVAPPPGYVAEPVKKERKLRAPRPVKKTPTTRRKPKS